MVSILFFPLFFSFWTLISSSTLHLQFFFVFLIFSQLRLLNSNLNVSFVYLNNLIFNFVFPFFYLSSNLSSTFCLFYKAFLFNFISGFFSSNVNNSVSDPLSSLFFISLALEISKIIIYIHFFIKNPFCCRFGFGKKSSMKKRELFCRFGWV